MNCDDYADIEYVRYLVDEAKNEMSKRIEILETQIQFIYAKMKHEEENDNTDTT